MKINEVGLELKKLRQSGGVLQSIVSDKTGIAQKTISRIENGVDLPRLETLDKLADSLGYEVEINFKRKGEKF